MRLNLCEIIEMSGKSLEFSCNLETERLLFSSIKSFVSPPFAKGEITNAAGALTLTGTISTELIRICDRCGCEYPSVVTTALNAKLAADLADVDDPEIFPLDGNYLDLDDLLETCFILSAEAKSLCKEDCAGLCGVCGKNLNVGPCACKKEIDPRLAVLSQLLDKQDK